MKPRVIAFYLPQFFPTSENDEWWEPGFTEWTNVTRTKPLFRGHYQPRLPRDLGFYDLRVSETREKQAELARYAGIEGFCYWHYWFAGRRMLDRPFREVVESGKPDFPFCLCWANHSWYAKTWDANTSDKLLIEQTYPGEQDYVAHFYAMLPAFKDKRYMKVDGRLIFGIFSPQDFSGYCKFSEIWNCLAKENGLKGFFFFGFVPSTDVMKRTENMIYDAIVLSTVREGYIREDTFIGRFYRLVIEKLKRPYAAEYGKYVKTSIRLFKENIGCVPCIAPDFDHSPRSGRRALMFRNSSPEWWKMLCKETLKIVLSKENEEKLIFIKAWNEWGEGNYMEPDQKFGRGYIEASREVFLSEND